LNTLNREAEKHRKGRYKTLSKLYVLCISIIFLLTLFICELYIFYAYVSFCRWNHCRYTFYLCFLALSFPPLPMPKRCGTQACRKWGERYDWLYRRTLWLLVQEDVMIRKLCSYFWSHIPGCIFVSETNRNISFFMQQTDLFCVRVAAILWVTFVPKYI